MKIFERSQLDELKKLLPDDMVRRAIRNAVDMYLQAAHQYHWDFILDQVLNKNEYRIFHVSETKKAKRVREEDHSEA